MPRAPMPLLREARVSCPPPPFHDRRWLPVVLLQRHIVCPERSRWRRVHAAVHVGRPPHEVASTVVPPTMLDMRPGAEDIRPSCGARCCDRVAVSETRALCPPPPSAISLVRAGRTPVGSAM